ncbi:MAG: hypothetical protein AAGA80_17750 [Cyanobacteria bacterium P01_F01_bin.143]
MDNNVPKNVFFSRSTQLYLTLDNISIKQFILKRLQEIIVIYQTKNCISQDDHQIISSLSDKIILQESPDNSFLVYSSAIAFPLANLFNLRSRQVAEDLVSLLASNSPYSPEEGSPSLRMRINQKGLIEFAFCDRSIGRWLECLGRRGNGETGRWGEWGDGEMGRLGRARSLARGGDLNWFPVQYVHNRCCSLLRLGASEGLIKLNKTWQITNPNPFQHYWDKNIGYRYEPTEINLLHQISLVIDYMSDRNSQVSKTWWLLNLNLSDACLKFIAACRIFGSVSRNQRSLAIARLGLIAIVRSCLQRVILE